jgi:DNA-binding transcriptional regulator LsrR (DeoR family)
LTYGAAARLKAESHLADFPALLDNTLIRNGIMQSQHFKTISSYWDNLDVALVGIGSPAIRDGATGMPFTAAKRATISTPATSPAISVRVSTILTARWSKPI